MSNSIYGLLFMSSATKELVVTIDGPAGAGKSTVAKGLAQALGYRLLDTGALYRAVALEARRRGISWNDEDELASIAAVMQVGFHFDGNDNRVAIRGEDVTAAIRTPEISDAASLVSALPGVRAALVDLQRRLGAGGGVVVEGRDTGTVIFPDAEAKFFLTASDEIRARRRYEELAGRGAECSFDETLSDMQARDRRDTGRAVAPLSKAPGAIVVDSSELDAHAVIEQMLDHVRTRASAAVESGDPAHPQPGIG